jgi:AcrR family transcriptional regulator
MPSSDVEPIIWLRPEVTGRGRPPTYSRAQLAQAAVELADAEGLEALSMRRVAARIGAGTMSLYRYVRTKDELYALMLDEIAPAPQLDADDLTWRTILREIAWGIRTLVLQHPWYPEVSAAVGLPGPRGARGLETLMAALSTRGLSDEEIQQALYSVLLYAIAATQNDLAEARAIQRSGLTPARWRAQQQRYLTALAAEGRTPTLCRLSVGARTDGDALFARMLDTLLDGIEATCASSDRAAT